MSSLEQSDKEAAAVQQPGHPRVTLDDIKANIASADYVNAFDAVNHSRAIPVPPGEPVATAPQALRVLTLCIATTQAGFTIVGKSAPADPANFDEALGQKLAYEDCIRQLWPLMGFALRERLHAEAKVN